jgi:hypothetical protein
LSRKPWVWNTGLALGLFLVNALLNVNAFLPGEMPYRDSIEGGYASMARFYAQNPNPWGWNTTVYCGLPAQSTYLPGLSYLTAALSWVFPGVEITHLYRLVTAVLTCLGPVTVFLFALYFVKNRWWALATAAGYTLFSPCYRLVGQINWDRGVAQLPWRVQVLVKYGEGPHSTGLTLLPLALMASWAAAVGRKYWQILLAAVSLAAIALIHWVAAFALAICCVLLLLTLAGTGKRTGFRAWRLLAAGVLAYLLACFWLLPSLVETTALNWPFDAFNYQLQQQQVWQLLLLAGGILALRAVFLRFPGRDYLCFLTLSVFAFGFIVLAYYWHGQPTIPESRRYALEFELFLMLWLFEVLRRGFRDRMLVVNFCALGLLVWLIWVGRREPWGYLTEDNRKWRPGPPEQTVEYQVGRWLAERNPAGRVFVTGGTCFRLNSWFDLDQVNGTFETGLKNRIPVHFSYQIRTGIGSRPGEDGRDAVAQLKGLGVEYVVVHGPRSREHWKDFKNPQKFEGLLEAVWRQGDDVIYRLPFSSLAHLVRPDELPPYPPIHGYIYFLKPYVAALEDASRPKLTATWRGANELEVAGPVPAGMRVSVQVSHDPGWEAVQGERRIPIEKDKLGFLVLRAEPAAQARITLHYHGTREQRLMTAISALAWLGALGGLFLRRRPS